MGAEAVNRNLTVVVEPANMGEQLYRTISVMIEQEDGSLAELPDFIVFDEDEFEVVVSTSDEEDQGVYNIVVTVEFPNHPGLATTRKFTVDVKSAILDFLPENLLKNERFPDEFVNLGCGQEWQLEVPSVLENPLEEHSLTITTVRRGDASSFLSHNSTTGQYEVLPNVISAKHSGSYKVEVVL